MWIFPALAVAGVAAGPACVTRAEVIPLEKGSGGQTSSGSGGTGGSALPSAGGEQGGGATLPPSGGMAGVGAAQNSGGTPGSGGNTATGGVGGDSGGEPGGEGGANPATGGMDGSAGMGGSPPTGTGNFPFPQNRRFDRCTYPSNADSEAARRAYERWKEELVTADGAGGYLRVRRPDSPGAEVNSTVSEGIAYGMMLAVIMGDQPTFDALWKYSQLWVNENGLMHWYINAAGTQPLGTGAATDSDEDMAWALVLADRQWGGSGSLDRPYIEEAKAQIQRIWEHEIDHDHDYQVLAGDSWGGNRVFNPSYFAPNEYRIFGEVTGNEEGWNRVIDTGYALLEKCLNAEAGNANNGLAPAWCDPETGEPKPTNGADNYQYDSARIPFRIGQDYCYSGDDRAKAYLQKVSAFFAGVGAKNIVDGYELDGTPSPDPATPAGSPQSAVFVGSAAVGAMHDPQYQAFIDEAYGLVATGELLARSRYYNLSWTGLTLLMLTGNLVEF